MSNIAIELNKEDRKVLEGLTGAVSLLASVLGSMQPGQVQQTIVQEATEHLEPVNALAPAAAAEPAPVESVPEVKPVSLAEFQKAVTQAVAKGTKQKETVRSIITKYAPSVSEVPEDKRAEVMAELAKI